MKRYYEYISGKTPGSTCGKFGNGLTTTYDYWYSCSGMDDYPAQVAMIAQDKKQYMCPCLSTSHTIRAAKIMKMVLPPWARRRTLPLMTQTFSG